MVVLVTGSSGLVGSAIQKIATEGYFFAKREDADLTNFDQTMDLFNRIRPDKVIHLAALVGGIGGNLMHSGEYFRNNLLINANVLEENELGETVGSKAICTKNYHRLNNNDIV